MAFVGIPGEYFVELGIRIQKESPFPYTFIVELANGELGYIPTRRGFAEGGYEPTSTPLAPGAGETMADTGHLALETLHSIAFRRSRGPLSGPAVLRWSAGETLPR